MPWVVFLRAEQWRRLVAELRRPESGFHDPRVAAIIAEPLAGLEPHHVMRLSFRDEDYVRTVYPAGLALGIALPVAQDQ